MDSRVHAKLLKKVGPMPSSPESGKLYVRKSDQVIVKTTKRYCQPACTLCLEEMADLGYDDLCKHVKMKQHSKCLQQGSNFYVCCKHRKSDDWRLRQTKPYKASSFDVSRAQPVKLLKDNVYRCILCPEKMQKRGQSNLKYLLCHKCYLCALDVPDCPAWIRDIRRSKCCTSCGKSRASTKAGDRCVQCKQDDEFEPDEGLLKEIRKATKSTFL